MVADSGRAAGPPGASPRACCPARRGAPDCGQIAYEVTGLTAAAEEVVAARPELVWDLVADITRVGGWSPECIRAAWLGESGRPQPGARFTGHNRTVATETAAFVCELTDAWAAGALTPIVTTAAAAAAPAAACVLTFIVTPWAVGRNGSRPSRQQTRACASQVANTLLTNFGALGFGGSKS